MINKGYFRSANLIDTIMALSKDIFKRGTLDFLLLVLLQEQDMYGRQMKEELSRRTNGVYSLVEGAMYPVLYRLEEQQLITHYERRVSKRQVKIFYHLTSEGLACVRELRDDYLSIAGCINTILEEIPKEAQPDEQLLSVADCSTAVQDVYSLGSAAILPAPTASGRAEPAF